MKPGHRTDFSKLSQKIMAEQNESFSKFTDDPKFEKFMNNVNHMYYAPMVIYFTLNKGYTPYNVFDIGGFGQVLMLAAKDYGVDSLVAYSLSTYPDVLRKYMKVPDDEDIVMGIAFGYEDDSKMNQFRSTWADIPAMLACLAGTRRVSTGRNLRTGAGLCSGSR